jgi:hypothetical protein
MELTKSKAADLAPIIDELARAGVLSLGGIAQALTAQGIPTARGGTTWHATQVARVLRRMGRW